jgi:integrase/recombinase XerD
MLTGHAGVMSSSVDSYRLSQALRPSDGSLALVIEGSNGALHHEGTTWLRFMGAAGKSPNTVKAYGLRLAAYLSWTAANGREWQSASLNDLLEFKTSVRTSFQDKMSPVRPRLRKPGTVNAWMIAITEFYKWAEASELISQRLSGYVYEPRYIAAGLYGGEQGRVRQVRVPELHVKDHGVTDPVDWIESEPARARVLELELGGRDRFLVDLLYFTGLRIGEALALFREDLHFLADSSALGCPVRGPHVHVCANEVTNGARLKTGPRWVPVPDRVVFSYEDYLLERQDAVGLDDNPHVFINLYRRNRGAAMSYAGARDLFERISRIIEIRLRPHMLRHTRATMWLRGIDTPRLDMDTVRVLLGHASLETTTIYAHSRAEDLRAAVSNADLPIQSGGNP